MRNYAKEVEQLSKDIQSLDTKKRDKETQLRCIVKEEKESLKEKRATFLKDSAGSIIRKGNWVKAITQGKFEHNEGEIVGFKKWVTFLDVTGVKQVRAPNNLLIIQNVRECSDKSSSDSRHKRRSPRTDTQERANQSGKCPK